MPALDLERQVVDRVREIGRDPGLVEEVVRQARTQLEEGRTALRAERRRLSESGRKGGNAEAARLSALGMEIAAVKALRIRERDVARGLAQFDGVWDALLPRERSRVFRLLVERIDYGPDRKTAIRFRIRAGAAGAA